MKKCIIPYQNKNYIYSYSKHMKRILYTRVKNGITNNVIYSFFIYIYVCTVYLNLE